MNGLIENTLQYLLEIFGLNGFLYLKDLFVFFSALFGGIIIQMFLHGWVWNDVKNDSTLKNIAVLRVQEHGKYTYYTNTNSALDIVDKTVLIALLKLSRKKKITLADAKKSKVTTYSLLIILTIFFISGLIVAMNHIDVLKWHQIIHQQTQ